MTASNINTVYTNYLMSLFLSICQERPVLFKPWKEDWRGMEWVGAVPAKRAGVSRAYSLQFHPTHSLALTLSLETPSNDTVYTAGMLNLKHVVPPFLSLLIWPGDRLPLCGYLIACRPVRRQCKKRGSSGLERAVAKIQIPCSRF